MGYFSTTTTTSYDPCKQKCCSAEWSPRVRLQQAVSLLERHPNPSRTVTLTVSSPASLGRKLARRFAKGQLLG
jgi:hypothetical protein